MEIGYDYDVYPELSRRKARLYDSGLGRFMQVDPMAEKFRDVNGYCGMYGNPISIIDPSGEIPLKSIFGRKNFLRISSSYNLNRKHPILGKNQPHYGVDLVGNLNSNVRVLGKGKVIFAGSKNGYGNTVYIQRANGYVSKYAHLESISVSVGDNLSNGQFIGVMGNTGTSSGAHTHVEILFNGVRIDPESISDLQDEIDKEIIESINNLRNTINELLAILNSTDMYSSTNSGYYEWLIKSIELLKRQEEREISDLIESAREVDSQ